MRRSLCPIFRKVISSSIAATNSPLPSSSPLFQFHRVVAASTAVYVPYDARLPGKIPYEGFKPPTHMVFYGLYPANQFDSESFSYEIKKLTHNDTSVSVTKESSDALGMGFRCGFIVLHHMDDFLHRLEKVYNSHIITTNPTVPYIFEYADGSKAQVQSPAQLSSNPKTRVTSCWEPMAIATIVLPTEYVGTVLTLFSERRGEQLEYSIIDSHQSFIKYRLPMGEIVDDFYKELKSITSGHASFDYEYSEYQSSDLVKVDVLFNGKPMEAMSTIVHSSKAKRKGSVLVENLKQCIDRQVFEYTIEAAIGSKIIARETLSARR